MDSEQFPPAAPMKERGSRRGKSRSFRLGLLSLAGVLILMALFARGYLPRVEKQRELFAAVRASSNARPRVSVAAVRRSPVSTDLVLPGDIQAIDETPIYARADGYLRRRLVDIGDRVEAGQLLAEIETPELDQQIRQARASLEQLRAALLQARANLTQARANLQLAEITLKRWKSLVEQGVLSAQAGDEKQSAYDARLADVGAGEANIKAAEANIQAGEANLQRLLELKSFQKVTAPFSGVITTRNVDTGVLITAGSGSNNPPMFRLAQIGTLRIYVNAPQTYVSSIHPGQAAQVLVQEFPRRSFAGKVVRTANALDEKSHTLLTEVQVANSDYALLPGMYSQVRFALARASPSWRVPGEALVIRPDGVYVALVRNDRTLHYQKVTLGRDYGTEVEVPTGLRGDERVVLNPADDLAEGMVVEAASPAAK
jgi:RND family efflux transporter MFP subunit